MTTKKPSDIRIAAWSIVAVTLLSALYLTTVHTLSGSWTERGQIGDAFGGLNAIFSGLAFAGVVYAIILQRREITHQREALELQREEMKKSSAAQEELSRSASAQLQEMRYAQQMERDRETAAAAPVLKVKNCTSSGAASTFHVRNHGSSVFNIQVLSTNPKYTFGFEEVDCWLTGSESMLVIKPSHLPHGGAIGFDLVYTDIHGRTSIIAFRIEGGRITRLWPET